MANVAGFYQSGVRKLQDDTWSYLSDTVKVALVRDTYTPNPDHDFMSDVTEIPNITGYTGGFGGSGRKTLASKTIVEDDTNNRVAFTAAAVAFGTLAIGATIGGLVALKEITNDAASIIFAFMGLAVDTPTNGSTVTWNFHADGLGIINCGMA
jgi:hypothetical protein